MKINLKKISEKCEKSFPFIMLFLIILVALTFFILLICSTEYAANHTYDCITQVPEGNTQWFKENADFG